MLTAKANMGGCTWGDIGPLIAGTVTNSLFHYQFDDLGIKQMKQMKQINRDIVLHEA